MSKVRDGYSVYQSGHNSDKTIDDSSSGVSRCFIHLSGILTWCIISNATTLVRGKTYQWKVALHCAYEPLPVLFWSNNRGFTSSSSSQECRFLDPTFEFLIPSVCANIIWYNSKHMTCSFSNRLANDANNELVVLTVNLEQILSDALFDSDNYLHHRLRNNP